MLDSGDYCFNGGTVWLDHGGELLTLYCHLAETDLKQGACCAMAIDSVPSAL